MTALSPQLSPSNVHLSLRLLLQMNAIAIAAFDSVAVAHDRVPSPVMAWHRAQRDDASLIWC